MIITPLMATTVLKPSLTLSRARFDLPIASLRPIRRDLGFQSRFQGVGVSRCFQKLHPIGYTKLKADRRSGVVSEVKDCASEVPDITKETWHAHVMECSTAVIVEFWAPWYGPCQVTHTIVAKLAKTYEGKLHCFKVNTDQCPDLSSQYGIKSIPTFIIFKDGEKKDAVIGAVPESTLVSFLEKTIGR